MRVSSHMIHKDLRFWGTIFKIFYRFDNEKRFKTAQKSVSKIFRGKKSKKISCGEQIIKNEKGEKLRLCIYKPLESKSNIPGILWLHGGGYAMGVPELELFYMEKLIEAVDCIIVSPDYRVSTVQPYPAALEDSYSTLCWIKQNAEELGIRNDQIFIGGNSAGGGLAVATVLYARDKGEVNIAFQMPLYPMLDDRMISASAKDNNSPVWNSVSNETAWKMYLGELYGTDRVPKYASPSRETDYSSLQPAYTYVGTIDVFYDETIAYINNLRNAGVSAKVQEYEGCFHGFDQLCKQTKIAQEAINNLLQEFVYAVNHYFSQQPDRNNKK